MNILIDALPESLVISGKRHLVNWGFRTFVLIELCIYDSKLSSDERIANALCLFYGDDIPGDLDQAFEKMMWFYRGGEKQKKETKRGGVSSSVRAYCFEQDAPLIYSAFRSQYGIDLQDIKSTDLHWWKFKSLFESLNEEQKLSKIMMYRLTSTTGMDKESKKFYSEMKKMYALETDVTADSKMALAKRDADMRKHIQRRVKEVSNENKGG